MAIPFTKSRRRPPLPNEAPVGDPYLTDGRRLYRIVSKFAPGTGSETALLEDCMTLEVAPHSPDELYEMGLRPVRRTGGTR